MGDLARTLATGDVRVATEQAAGPIAPAPARAAWLRVSRAAATALTDPGPAPAG